MKLKVIGSNQLGQLIQGKVKIGQNVVFRLNGKVEKGVVIRTKILTKTLVRFTEATVIKKESGAGGTLLTTKILGPISKGLPSEILALCKSSRI